MYTAATEEGERKRKKRDQDDTLVVIGHLSATPLLRQLLSCAGETVKVTVICCTTRRVTNKCYSVSEQLLLGVVGHIQYVYLTNL